MTRKTAARTFEVLVSFSALDKGDRFTQDTDDGWADQHVETGYLREVVEGVPDVGRAVGEGGAVPAGHQESPAR